MRNLCTRQGWIGDYDFGFLCLPNLPGFRKQAPAKFIGIKDRLPLAVAIIMGFQHCLAMLAGVVTPPLILSGPGPQHMNLNTEYRSYLISASLITCGLLSMIQMTRWRIPGTRYYMGTGLITVVGTSFTIMPVAESSFAYMYQSDFCPSVKSDMGVITQYLPCPQAYGALLGTTMTCSVLMILISFVPAKVLHKLFPPLVTGITVTLIGAHLVGSGLKNWGGGSGPCINHPASGNFIRCPNVDAPNALPWGHIKYMGLGFLVFISIILFDIFGSHFMRSAEVVLGLIIGLIVSWTTGYVNTQVINDAPVVTFLWVKTFPLSIYTPAIIPMLVIYMLIAVESIGTITACCDVSGVEVSGPVFETRIQGGVLADGLNSLLAGAFTNPPMSTFAQNNGIVALTRCANLTTGYACCFFLVFMGVFSKLASVFLAIPESVLGGMTTFLFANVLVSGIRILSYLKWTRRDRFIAAASMTLGMGTTIKDDWFSYALTAYKGSNTTVNGLIISAEMIVNSGFTIAALIAIVLNLVMPKEPEDLDNEESDSHPV
ncbi:Xanthine/uracil permease [Basidiobolus meristosporus CBS 931.73]|uniref:Xanthine/uracil permease n=1 Tax=Basidiobolus meristosporus CBS 931.73 TaxID=1314790 RepID=A0A1Y1YCA1_9FUNG|nr:Xanthine/uracil permease [Basidiobolus meristosporus CBS 931.73]|eukprot:ORX95573.1 Xanthine/uracil permease [Basidiobolus meristosporus CBS 931.73]